MQKETIMTLIRTALTLIGSYLIGKNLLGTQVDASTAELLVGIGMALASIVWGVLSKELNIEMLQSLIRQIGVGIGGVLLAAGKINPGNLESILGFVTAAATLLYSILSRKKSAAIVNGKIDPQKLTT